MKLLAAALMLFCMAASTAAQSVGEVVGSLVDQTGAPLPGVHMTIRGVAVRTADTGATGDFVFPDLPQADYEISAELNGFQPARRAVRVRAGERVTVSFTLRLAIVEETIVTAAKVGGRDVQDVPMSISAVSNAELGRLGTHTLGQAAALAPSVTLSQNASFGQLTIRGIGANVLYAGGDPSSAMYLDGVYLARPAMEFVQFLDLDRVEVLRGPQGTLYGRNAVGGAVNLISKAPTNDFQTSADFTAGNSGEFRADARISGPLKRDKVMGSVAFARGVRDGYVRDLEHPDHPLGGDDVTAARGQLRVVFDRRTDLVLSSDVDVQDGTPLSFNKVLAAKPGFAFEQPTRSPRGAIVGVPLRSDPPVRRERAAHDGAHAIHQPGQSDRLSNLDYEFFVDADMTELNLVTTHQHEWQHQLSEEITIVHQQPRLTWVAGVFLFDEFDHQSFWVDQPVAGLQVRLDPYVDAASRAVFGQATVGVTPRLSLTGGLRYTREAKDIDNAGGRYALEAPYTPVTGSVYSYSDSISHDAWTPKVGLEMKLPHDALAYMSATRGFKSGGFNPSSTAAGRGYAPEWAWSYEGGWKGTLRGGRSRFAMSAFVMDYTYLQVQTPIAIAVFDIRNAAAATIRGVEWRTRHGSDGASKSEAM